MEGEICGYTYGSLDYFHLTRGIGSNKNVFHPFQSITSHFVCFKKNLFCLNMLLFPVNILCGTKDFAERDRDVLYRCNSKHILCLQFI